MGIIQRQSIKNSIVSFIGVLIAMFSTLFIYKLDERIYGFAQFIYSSAFFLTPLASLGVVASAIKFFPQFSGRKEAFFNVLLLSLLGLSIIFVLACMFFGETICSLLEVIGIDEKGKFRQYSWVIIPLTLILNVNVLLMNQAANMRRIVIPELINNLGYKLVLPCIVLIAYLAFIDQLTVALAILGFFLFVSMLLSIYLYSLQAINVKAGLLSLSSAQKKEFTTYSLFSGLNTMGSTLALRIDIIMITTIMSYEAAGIYGILMFLANVIEIPRRAINKIAAPIISEAWTKDDVGELKMIYKKSSINLLFIGIPLFLSIWFSLPFLDLISAGEDRFVIAKFVFLFLALGKLFDMMMSVNSELIIYSPRYRVNLVFLIFLGIANVILNFYLIKAYGIAGAALATCISYFIFNVGKFIFIWWVFKLTPFTAKTALLVLIGVVIFALVSKITFLSHMWFGSLVQILLVGLLYFPIVLFLNLSPDVNNMVKGYWQKLRT